MLLLILDKLNDLVWTGIFLPCVLLCGLLPAAATCVYTWFLDLKDAVQLKIVIIVTLLCWAVYDFVFKNYVTFAFDFGAVVSNLIGIVTLRRAAKPE